jgi:hypothetical protein
MSPSLQVESTEPVGTSTVLCSHLVISGSTLFYPANYTPTGRTLRNGIFKLPIAGGASTDVLATGDTAPSALVSGASPLNPAPVTGVSTNSFSTDPLAKLIANYAATYTISGQKQTINFNSYPVGNPQRFSSTLSNVCPGVSLPPLSEIQPVSTDGTVFANFVNGTGTNYQGVSTAMQFIQVGPWPYAGCSAVVFAPDLGSLNGGTTYILPGEPQPNSSTRVSTMTMGQVAVSNGVVYVGAAQTLSATQGSYSGIFTVAYNLNNANGTYGTFPLTNGIWPASQTPIPTKIISDYDPVPGITLGLATCAGGISQTPSVDGFTVAGNYLIFRESQELQDCTSMAVTSAGGIYAYNLTTKAIQVVAPYGAVLVPNDAFHQLLRPHPRLTLCRRTLRVTLSLNESHNLSYDKRPLQYLPAADRHRRLALCSCHRHLCRQRSAHRKDLT